jgi:hypothetical protein
MSIVGALVEDRDREPGERDGWRRSEQSGKSLGSEALGKKREGDYE